MRDWLSGGNQFLLYTLFTFIKLINFLILHSNITGMQLQLSDIANRLGLSFNGIDSSITILLTDSRSLTAPKDTLFFALHTKEGDGHAYIKSLYDKGVRNFIVERIPEDMIDMHDANMLIVPDTLNALQQICTRSDNFEGKIIAITGSKGKTTLKEWLYALLSPYMKICRSPRSYNSQIGVPLSMWEIENDADIAIIEAGISKSGEMVHLADIIQPDIVIYTNIGDEHSEGFSSLEEKAKEKTFLSQRDNTRQIIFNDDCSLIKQALSQQALNKDIFSWSRTNPDAQLFIKEAIEKAGKTYITYTYQGNTSEFILPATGEANIENACNALAMMLYLGITAEDIRDRFASLTLVDTRLNVSEGVNGCSVILDGYTADFSSLLPTLDFMRRHAGFSQSKTLILSDLHRTNRDLVKKIALLTQQVGINRIICIGEKLYANADCFPTSAQFFHTTDEFMANMSTSDFSNEIILLKGAPEFAFHRIAENLEARTHETVLEVNLDAIVRNFKYFKSHLPAGSRLTAMVKASAYGLGSYEIGKTLQEHGADYLAVAVLDEGIELRRKGITMPIMVMNPKVVNYKAMFINHLEPEIYNMEMLADVMREAEKNNISDYPIHLKLDTGMHRMGFIEEELPELCRMLSANRGVRVASVFSHLATADCLDMDDYTMFQVNNFERMTSYLQEHLAQPFLRHLLNSAGILRFSQYAYDMARLGIGLYGINTLPPEIEQPLSTVATLRTIIIAVRDRQPGDTIGYSRKGVISKPSKIATIPIGYADGMNRKFGNGAVRVLVNGKEAPTIGNICMDACMIDVTGIDCKVGDSVEIFGPNMSVDRLAQVLDTIPYEVITSISPRVKRIYFRE